jgi:hypothetical protein
MEDHIRRARARESIHIEKRLNIKFPDSYRKFIFKEGSAVIDGYQIFGLPTQEVSTSVLEATEILRILRPELPPNLIVISIHQDRALCLNLDRRTKEDCFLIDVSLKKDSDLSLEQLFGDWIKIHQKQERRFKDAYQKIVTRRKETEKKIKSNFGSKKGFSPRPQDWHPIVSEVHDYIVGMTATRYNYRYHCLEVDEFYALDHPHYKKGEAIQNLLKIIFIMARDFSGLLDIIFTQEERTRRGKLFRNPRPIPKELVNLAKEYGITFEKPQKGRIFHREGVKLFFALLNLPSHVQERIAKLEEMGYLSREMIAEVINSGIWDREEAIWLFLNAPRAEAVLLGSVIEENRLYYSEAVNYARSALLVTRLKQVIMHQMREGFSPEERLGIEINLEPKENFWIMKSEDKFYFPPSWTIDKTKIWVEAQEPVLLLSRPWITARKEENEAWLKNNIDLLLNKESKAKVRCLLINYEFISEDFNASVKSIKKIVKEAALKRIYILFPNARTPILLDNEIEKRMRRSRSMKKFPLREGPLNLRVFEIQANEWNISSGAEEINRNAVALRNASQDAVTISGYISKKVDIHHYRRQFAFNCEVVERVALCYHKSKRINKIDGKESEEIIKALKGINTHHNKRYNTITYSYVRPPEVPEFLSKLKGKSRDVLSKVNGGIVFVVEPFNKIEVPIANLEISESPSEIPDIIYHKINARVKEKIAKKEYIKSNKHIEEIHKQIKRSLQTGFPLAVSWIQPIDIVQTIRDYLEYQERRRWLFWRHRFPAKPAKLRIEYNDGSEGKPFPVFCLRETFRKPKNLFQHHASLVSLRHMEVDHFAENSIIRNREIQYRDNSAEQEEIAFWKVYYFLETFIKLVRHEVEVEKVSKTQKIFFYLWEKLDLVKKRANGLEPATIGGFRAVVEILKRYRGRIVVVPRFFTGRIKERISFLTPKHRIDEICNENYVKGETWF